MDMTDMMSGVVQPNRPASRKANTAIAPFPKERMFRVDGGQSRAMFLNRTDDSRPQGPNFRFDPTEQRSISLGSSAHRLVEIFSGGDMKRSQQASQPIKGREPVRQIEY